MKDNLRSENGESYEFMIKQCEITDLKKNKKYKKLKNFFFGYNIKGKNY